MTTAIDSVFLSFRIGFYGVINQDECQYIFFISQGFRIITPAILYRGNLLVCCTGVAYGEAAFSLLLRYPKSQPV